MTWSFSTAEKGAFIALCSAALKAHNFLTGSAHGKLHLVKQKRGANESLLKLESHKVSGFTWSYACIGDPTCCLMESVSFPVERHGWFSCLCFQGITKSLELCVSSRSPPYLPRIDHYLWTLDPQKYPGENPSVHAFHLPRRRVEWWVCLIGLRHYKKLKKVERPQCTEKSTRILQLRVI